MKNTTLCLLTGLISVTSFSQFTADQDLTFGDGGNLWYNYEGLGSSQQLSEMVLDENSESFYFAGIINYDQNNAMIFKGSLDGEPDESLAEGTIFYDPFLGLEDQFQSVTVQENGKMVATGYSTVGADNTEIIIARFNQDGTFDPTFNSGTVITFGGSGFDLGEQVLIQDDGKIIVIGSYENTLDDERDSFVMRLNSDGSLDGTFGAGGIQYVDTNDGFEYATHGAILENGHIAAVGKSGADALIFVLDEEGNLDTDFNIDGILNFKVNSLSSSINKVIELEDGSLLISGFTLNADDGPNSFVIKLQSDGNFTTDFNGIDGTLYLSIEQEMGTDTSFRASDMEVFDNGQILLSAHHKTANDNIGLVLINPDGTLDESFGEGGIKVVNVSGGSLSNYNGQIEIASNGRVYLSAQVVGDGISDIVTWRFFADYTHLEENETRDSNLLIYPNPTSDQLTVLFENNKSDFATINILDGLGRLVTSYEWNQLVQGKNTFSLTNDIQGLAPGNYYVQILTDQSIISKKFIKQ